MYYNDYRFHGTPDYDDDPTIPSGEYSYRVVDEQPRYNGGQSQGPKQPRKKKRSMAKKVVSLCLCGALFGGVAGLTFHGTASLLEGAAATTGSHTGVTVSQLSATTATGSLDVSHIAKATLPSIVSITNRSVQEVEDWFSYFYGYGGRGSYGYPGATRTQESTSVGSGILIKETSDALYIVTNYHVIEDATTLSATFADGETYEAQLVGGDESNDIAVIKVPLSSVSNSTLSQIQVAAIGGSDSLEVGEQVVAIGNALGYGQSVTTGVVSALNRSISTETSDSATYIQTDAAINPGNSGGALLNMNGEVVGINTAKLSSTEVEGMGYAIPIARAAQIVGSILAQDGSTL